MTTAAGCSAPDAIQILSGWGRYPRLPSRVVPAVSTLSASGSDDAHGVIARGNGRAYGDAAIGTKTTLVTSGLNRFCAFDPETGLLRAEAGVLLADIVATFLPRGFFPPVVPGTQLVSLGGMIASDVHGKNHHRDGGFGDHVQSLVLAGPGGTRLVCSRRKYPDLFAMTVGGMGLTGTIVEATIRLRPVESGWIRQETHVAADLSDMLHVLDATQDATYSVAWIDCAARGAALGRGLVYIGEHAGAEACLAAGQSLYPSRPGRSLTVPPICPGWTLNRISVGAFNALYHRRGAAKADGPHLVPWHGYFFPLDGLNDWNRLYGRRGLLQHQCVVPPAAAHGVLSTILEAVSRLGNVSPLAVLKRLGRARGGLSFPMEGYTLALDMPVSPDAFECLARIDRTVVAAGGRLYLAKDARQSRETFEAGYPDLAGFRDLRRAMAAETCFASRLSQRLGL